MKIFKISFLVVASCFTFAQAAHLIDDFESYADGEALMDFYWSSDTTLALYGGEGWFGVRVNEITAADVTPPNPSGTITTKAVYFDVNDTNLDPNGGEWIHFEAVTHPAGSSSPWMQFDAAVVVNETIRLAEPNLINPSLVAEVWYYFLADTTGDGSADVYYETFVTEPVDPNSPLNTPCVLQPYPRRYLFGDNPDVWDRYDLDDSSYLGDSVGVPIDHTRNITEFGMQFRLVEAFDTLGETDYFTIWIDNVILIPEPGTMGLVIGAMALLAVRRRRR